MQVVTDAVASWSANAPGGHRATFSATPTRIRNSGAQGYDLLAALPEKPKRNPDQTRAAETILRIGRESREAFMGRHAEAVYRALTKDQSTFVRAEELVYEAANLLPGLTPTRQQVAAQSEKPQRDKDGIEVDQGIFFANILAHPTAGAHFCHAMLLPQSRIARAARRICGERRARPRHRGGRAQRQGRDRLLEKSALPQRRGRGDAASNRNRGRSRDPRFQSELALLRGDIVDNPKYRGRRVFSTGINLTHLYHGKISYLWYVTREMGFVNKMMRGLARPDANPDEIYGGTTEKPWIAGVEALRDRRRLPVSAHDGLRGGGERRLHDPAGPQGRHHSGRRQHAPVALHRRQASPGRRSCRGAGSIATRPRAA